MGFTYVKTEISNIHEPSRKEELDLLADTSAMFSIVPRQVLERCGIMPESRDKFTLANGKVIEREVGHALFAIEQKRRISPVIFGEPKDATVLGAVTLETLGYEVDPVTKKLKPATLYLI